MKHSESTYTHRGSIKARKTKKEIAREILKRIKLITAINIGVTVGMIGTVTDLIGASGSS